MTEFVRAWSIATGREQMVPEHFFDNPLLCRDLTRVAPAGAEPDDEQPTGDWTIPRLRGYADDHDIDLTGLTLKGDIYAAITAAIEEAEATAAEAAKNDPPIDNPAVTAIGTAHPAPSSPTTETPATGENQE